MVGPKDNTLSSYDLGATAATTILLRDRDVGSSEWKWERQRPTPIFANHEYFFWHDAHPPLTELEWVDVIEEE